VNGSRTANGAGRRGQARKLRHTSALRRYPFFYPFEPIQVVEGFRKYDGPTNRHIGRRSTGTDPGGAYGTIAHSQQWFFGHNAVDGGVPRSHCPHAVMPDHSLNRTQHNGPGSGPAFHSGPSPALLFRAGQLERWTSRRHAASCRSSTGGRISAIRARHRLTWLGRRSQWLLFCGRMLPLVSGAIQLTATISGGGPWIAVAC
jgi:hypothetical protein